MNARSLPVLAALVLASLTPLANAQTPPATPAASAPQEGARPEVATPVNAAQTAIRAGLHAQALALLAQAESVPSLTPIESFFIERTRGVAAAESGNDALAIKSFENLLALNRLQGAERLPFLDVIARSNYRARKFPEALAAMDRYFAAGGDNVETARLRVNAQYLSGNHAAAIPGLEARVKAGEGGGKSADETSLRMLADSYAKTGNAVAYDGVLEKLVSAYPRKELWRELISKLQKRVGFNERQWLDGMRLLEMVGALDAAELFTAYAESALLSGLPIEAKRVLDTGYEERKLGTGPNAARHGEMRAQANKQAPEDVKALATNPTPRAADAMVATGEGQVSAGRIARGIELIEQGIAQGGLRRPDEAKLRLAQAYLSVGNKAKALETFKSLSGVPTGGFAELARYWTLAIEKN